jgi:hypothetical protein
MTHTTTTEASAAPFLSQTGAVDLLGKLGAPMSLQGFLNGVKAGTLPQPVHITPKRPLWRADDLHAFLKSL